MPRLHGPVWMTMAFVAEMEFPRIIKIRRWWDRLIFVMGIPSVLRRHFYNEKITMKTVPELPSSRGLSQNAINFFGKFATIRISLHLDDSYRLDICGQIRHHDYTISSSSWWLFWTVPMVTSYSSGNTSLFRTHFVHICLSFTLPGLHDWSAGPGWFISS